MLITKNIILNVVFNSGRSHLSKEDGQTNKLYKIETNGGQHSSNESGFEEASG